MLQIFHYLSQASLFHRAYVGADCVATDAHILYAPLMCFILLWVPISLLLVGPVLLMLLSELMGISM
jgi:hypothetical protein